MIADEARRAASAGAEAPAGAAAWNRAAKAMQRALIAGFAAAAG